MSSAKSLSQRRLGVAVNYAVLLLSLVLGIAGIEFGWTTALRVGFWLSILLAVATFFPLHIRTGLWRLVHTKVEALDEREIQQTLESLRRAYVVFSIAALIIMLALVILNFSNQILLLVVFWFLLYLAHTLPSSILAWTIPCVPTQNES